MAKPVQPKKKTGGPTGGQRPSISTRRYSIFFKNEDGHGHDPSGWADDIPDSKTPIKPPRQADLTEEELNQDITCVLRADNPLISESMVQFSFKDLVYKPVAHVPHTAVLFSLKGSIVHKSLADAEMGEGKQAPRFPQQQETKHQDSKEIKDDIPGLGEEGDDTKDDEGSQMETESQKDDLAEEEDEALDELDQKRRNKFNFSDRAIQTFDNPSREHGLQTEPPPRVSFSLLVSEFVIYDAYLNDFKTQKDKKGRPKKEEEKPKRNKPLTEAQGDELSKVEKISKIVERMVNQNTFDDIALDYKYWEDPSDEFRELGGGSLLPLWKFSYRPVKQMAVSSLSWNSQYTDLFAVGYGSYDFLQQSHGTVCLFSLKSPSYPDKIFHTDATVYTLEFHPKQSNLLAVGLCDGAVAVFNLQSKKNSPAFSSIDTDIKHFDSVWKVRWLKDNLDGHHNFCSVSADGRVVNWALVKNELVSTDVILLKKDDCTTEGPEGTQLDTVSSGTSISFNPDNTKLFVVGTEDGLIHKCSTVYTSQYLMTYQGHHLSVYNVQWNSFHPRVFISCSADWKVSVWDHTLVEPVFIFDLSHEVGDVKWSPYSSTVFAAVTADGKVHLFDLSVNKHEPICVHVVVRKKGIKPTRVAFNPQHPVIIVGDDRGRISSFKMSPNLRSSLKNLKTMDKDKFIQAELEKMDKLLMQAKDPANKAQ